MKMPWSQTLHERLKELWGSEFAENLMALWTTPDRNSNENKSGCVVCSLLILQLVYMERTSVNRLEIGVVNMVWNILVM